MITIKIIWRNTSGVLVATQENRLPPEHFTLLDALSEKTEVQVGNFFYQIKGLKVLPPMENPPEIHITAVFVRQEQADYGDC